jgi:hypothetical protein
MIPFLNKAKPQAGLLTVERKPDETKEENPDDGIEACAQDLTNAIHAHDIKAVAAALKSAFELLDSEPHSEGPHTNEPENEQE